MLELFLEDVVAARFDVVDLAAGEVDLAEKVTFGRYK